MSDDESIEEQEPPVSTNPAEAMQVAKILTAQNGVRVKGFTFGKGQAISGVSLAMARHLEASGQVQILDLSNIP